MRVAAVGGGHGLARALAALRTLDLAPTAVVTVADDGGSSGRLRRDLGVIPPGDLRMALLALARKTDLAQTLEHRFRGGDLDGHALGNLFLVALAEQADGDFVAALDRAAALLGCVGRVVPATDESVELKARVAGEEVNGQVQVATAGGRVERVWLEPERPAACPGAVAALREADLVVLGPGSLFTSVIATLLVPGLAEALTGGDATVVYVANILTQPGETTGLTLDDHVEALLDHVPGLSLDAVVAHDGPVEPPSDGGEPVRPVLHHRDVGRVLAADVATRSAGGGVGWGHDPARLAAALRAVLPAGAAG